MQLGNIKIFQQDKEHNAEKLDDAAEKALDKVKKEYDIVFKRLTTLEAKEKKEKEKRNKTILKFLKDLFLAIFKGSKKR